MEGVDRPEVRDAVVGPKGFTCACLQDGFSRGREVLLWHEDRRMGRSFWNAGEYHEIVLHEKIVSSMYFSDSEGNKVEPEHYGIEHEAIEGAFDVTLFEDLGDGKTKLTFIGNEPMEDATKSGQVEGWKQILDKVAGVIAEMAAAK